MKKTLFLLSLLSLTALGFSQITLESGANLIVSNGSTVIANDGIVNNGGSIDNAGTIEIKGDLENNTTALTASTSTGTISFNGTVAQKITGSADADFYGKLEINNSSGVSIDTTAAGVGSNQTINDTLVFTSGLLTLNGFNLSMGSVDATGAGATQYVQTNSTGVVTRNVPADGATDVVYPVGNTAYNPITLQNSATATADNYSVRVVDAEPAGASTDHFVDRSWEITEAVATGSDLTVTPQWNSGEELLSFDRTNSSIGLTTDGGITYTWGATAAAAGVDPYTNSGTGFTDVGTFTVGDYFYSGKSFDLKLILAGAYNGTDMNNTLETAGLIPTTDPYGLSTTVSAVPAGAVDWIKIEFRDKTDHASILQSFARFVDTNGQVIEEDGTNFKITGLTLDNYFVAVLHRNHMGVVSSATVDLNVASPVYDFTTAQAQAWQNGAISTNAAMDSLATGVYGLWEGDANADGLIVYNGGSSDRVLILDKVGGVANMTTVISNVYDLTDINMNGNVVYNGGNSDRIRILDNVGGVANMTVVLNVHLP
ncbi:MAG: hypothetical protein L3J66_04650 [Bacteroidales bacterium]|nr:hypothetical protein [Bacteroidales bacterium]